MIPQAYRSFINDIISKTNEEEVTWVELKSRAYVLRSKTSTIEVGFYSDEDAELSYYYFQFFSLETRKSAGFRISHPEPDFAVMEELYSVAAASAANVQKELSSFLNNLQSEATS